MAQNLLITQGLGAASGGVSFLVLSFTPAPTLLTIQFSSKVSLTGDSADISNWVITPDFGVGPVTINSINVVNDIITITTSEHQTGGYTLFYPQGIVDFYTNDPFVGPFSQAYSGAGNAPYLTMVRGVDARAIDVVFSEAVLETDALNPANYVIIGPGSVVATSVEKQTDQAYRINTTVQDKLFVYTLQASNIHDLAGNLI